MQASLACPPLPFSVPAIPTAGEVRLPLRADRWCAGALSLILQFRGWLEGTEASLAQPAVPSGQE